jgi:hypothetical protein
MKATLKENFYWPSIDASVESLGCTYDTCQKCMLTAMRKYGKIPFPSNTKVAPWEEVHVYLIGPWDDHYNSTSVPGKGAIKTIQALTIQVCQNFQQSAKKTFATSPYCLKLNGCATIQGQPK